MICTDLNNREITEGNLRKADSFRIQTQNKKRRNKILWGAIYNWIAREYPEIAERIRNFIADLVIERLEQEFRTIIKSNHSARTRHNNFLKEIIPDSRMLTDVYGMVSDILK